MSLRSLVSLMRRLRKKKRPFRSAFLHLRRLGESSRGERMSRAPYLIKRFPILEIS
jgi:hypothetical protein